MSCDFSLKHYEFVLKTALKAGYEFVGFDEFLPDCYCILRHDVDYVPEWALRLGIIEQGLGIRSCFFFQVSAKTYNLADFFNREVVRSLFDMGHSVGVHVDLSNVENVSDFVLEEKRLFELITGVRPCEIVSIHCPSKNVLMKDVGVRHVYEEQFFKKIRYLSDSRNWLGDCVCKIFEKGEIDRIQLLLHPYIWQPVSKSFVKNLARVVVFRKEELVDYFLRFHPVCRANEEEFVKETKKTRR